MAKRSFHFYFCCSRNTVPFTPTQVEAIKSGMQPGLTMVVGPPGTGKTDVAVQIISNIYHNFPEQRTLIVTHSNQVCVVLSSIYTRWFSRRIFDLARTEWKAKENELNLMFV